MKRKERETTIYGRINLLKFPYLNYPDEEFLPGSISDYPIMS